MKITRTTYLDSKQWDLTIHPKRNLLDLRLGELWKARDCYAVNPSEREAGQAVDHHPFQLIQ